jgi:hypothetical protein
MSVHSEQRGKHRVRWRDDLGSNRSRTFRRKQDAERFDRKVKRMKDEEREKGHYTLPATFDPQHPEAPWLIVGDLGQLLDEIYPDHTFTISIDDETDQQLPLNGSISWEAESKADAALKSEDFRRRLRELGERHPELLDANGEVDLAAKQEAVYAAMDKESDLFGPSANGRLT